MQDQLNDFTSEASCPKCGGKTVSKVKYTWWGGVLGPRLLHHTKCDACGYRFNSKTGKSNTGGIILYSVVIFVVVLVIWFFIKNM